MRTRAAVAMVLTASAVVVVGLTFLPACSQEAAAVFGGPDDVTFAETLWAGMEGYRDWPLSSGVYEGASPHGAFLRMHYNMVLVDGVPYHVIIKDNFAGEGATIEGVEAAPMEHLAAVTVMVQREAGYDEDTGNWYWVKYDADGTVSTNDAGMKLAGRVAKGANQGCIACHTGAGGGDYLFLND